MRDPHPLLDLFRAAAAGRFPPADGTVAVVPALPGGLECSVGFTGYAVVATALDPATVRAWGPDAFGGTVAPDFLRRLAGPDGWIDVLDATLVSPGAGGPATLPAWAGAGDHPRVRHARDLRTGVRVFGDGRGLVTLAAGLAGRTEISVELTGAGPGRGSGRGLIIDALTLVPAGEPVFAAVAPGNARSLRAFLSAGFVPIGAKVIVRPGRGRAGSS